MGRTVRLSASAVAAAVLLACAAALLAAPAERAGAAFPGQNGKIAFQRQDMGNGAYYAAHIATADPDGTGFFRVTGDGSYTAPAFSPDGTTIATARRATVGGGIHVVPAAGGTPARLADTVGDDTEPAWSPDGKKIAFAGFGGPFVSGERPPYDIFVMNADGTVRTNLTPGRRGEQRTPAWSPDGKKIAFSEVVVRSIPGSDGDRINEDVFVMPAGGGAPAALAARDDADEYGPSWSPDGKKVAYSGIEYPSDPFSGHEIYSTPAAGGTPTRLTDTVSQGSIGAYEPAWSPDGELIAFTYDSGEYNAEVWAVPSAGGKAFRIVNDEISFAPDWAPIPGSAPPDAVPPRVVGVSPEASSRGVRRGADVKASSSEEMRPATVRGGTFRLVEASTGKRVAATVGCPAPCTQAELDSSAPLAANTRYRATLTTGVKDLAGNALDQWADAAGDQQRVWSFKTRN